MQPDHTRVSRFSHFENERRSTYFKAMRGTLLADFLSILLARIIHDCSWRDRPTAL